VAPPAYGCGVNGRVTGKTALITGAAQGLGEASARLLARQGARVFLTDIHEEGVRRVAAQINEGCGGGVAHARAHDVTKESDWAAVVGDVERVFGGLSVLVNNAGIVVPASVEEISIEDWHRSMRVNVDGVFFGIRKMLPLMRLAQPGSIINMSSIAALIASHNLASYNASKAAVWMLTKSVALHCARQGWDIRCNSVHPAFIRTPILRDLNLKGDQAALEVKLARQVPLGRLGEPDDVAWAVLYLASDESRFMTGAELKLDGGVSAM
jgi:NAD(P)-dependent dehydrogenase (short-subunit alcohol dehydrogenase family)